MAAFRRALARGATLSAAAMQPIPNAAPEMWLAPPSATDFPPSVLQGSLATSEIQAEIEDALPVWAGGSSVVVRDVIGERRVDVGLEVLPAQLQAVVDPARLVAVLLRKQVALNEGGAGIGGVSLTIGDATNGAPLLVYAGDATFGQNFHWISPLVGAWIDRVPDDSGEDVVEQAKAEVETTVQGLTTDGPGIP